MYAGAGAVVLDEDGITHDSGSSAYNKVKWTDGTNYIAHIFGDSPGGSYNRLLLRAQLDTHQWPSIELLSGDPSSIEFDMGTTAYFKIEEDEIWASGYTPLHLADLFSTPPSTPSSGALLYASSGELVGMDDAGNTTTLTPHNFSLIPDGPSEPMAWSYYSERDGRAVNVDMMKLARLVEELTGEQLVYIVNKMK